MFTLITDRSRYFKIKRGQSAGEVEAELNTPVFGQAFAGMVVSVEAERLVRISAGVGDSYRTLAAKYGADENRLKRLNGGKPVYPTCKIFVPKK